MNKININNFDFLRVVFAATVALAHLIELSEVEIFQPYKRFFNTRLAIDGFFVISGFLIAKSYEHSKSLKDYILKRVKRIVPAYFFVILFCAFFFCFISTQSISTYFLNSQFWTYLLANLTFQNYLQPCLPGVFQDNLLCAVNGALWTIKIEEAFYLLLPLFYLITKSKKSNIHILSIVVYLLSIVYYNYFVSADMYRIAKQLPGALAFFTTGIILYRHFDFFIKWKHHIILPCLLLFVLEQYAFNTQIFKPAVYGFMVFYFAYNFKFLNHFGKYGDLTYGIYIYHFPLIQVFVHLGFFKSYNPLLIAAILIVIIVVISALSWHFLELAYLSESRKERQRKLLLGE
ncbi:MAG: acyltransferase [Algibacter sp.]|uniref:acyltransferase family protein n=1 Tax=Algibacter sp. TaxID=1872428 RepID=UPI0026209E55|nr:acyltransferase [Algibacter sp.]MDG1730817.1 acyltransferase [Algibacter sp.]MDG2177523.1 acyltransferase [Algibacter sp.]